MDFIYDDKTKKQEIYNLYQEIFEDPKEFADYYFEEVYSKNQVLMAKKKEELVGTIHLNPYLLDIRGKEVPMHYIVAVATKTECRRQGIMREMLHKVLNDMAEAKEAFTYLEPANPAYYEPFDFVFAMDWSKDKIQGDKTEFSGILRGFECKKDADKVILFIESQLRSYDIHTKVTKDYLARIQKEAKSQGGDILLWEQENLSAVFVYGIEEDTVFIREAFCEKKDKFYEMLKGYFSEYVIEIVGNDKSVSKQIPSIMIRITNLCEMMSFAKAKNPICVNIEIKDSIILENNGTFQINITKQGGHIKRTQKQPQLKLTIKELTEILFGMQTRKEFQDLIPFDSIYITEEV
ncbi:MAG: GNAT family N-acetyltransferase [Anaerostipes sp.]|jgi:predicted acetyltransferase